MGCQFKVIETKTLKQDQLNFPFLDLPTEAKGKGGGQGINYYVQLWPDPDATAAKPVGSFLIKIYGSI